MSRLFSAYVIVDWSAASKAATGTDCVSIGVLKRDVRFRLAFESYTTTTRAEAEKRLGLILDDLKKRNEKAFMGFDFPLGFPTGLAPALKLTTEPHWRAVWNWLDKMVKDKADNTNNRFGVAAEINRRVTDGPFPFWGCAPRDTLTTLQPKKTRDHGEGDLPEMRLTDIAAKTGRSIWKLYYAGSIGGQTILGIPAVSRLKAARADAMKIWPLETGWQTLTPAELDGVDLVVAEVDPMAAKANPAPGEAKAIAQLRALAEQFAKLDEAGKFGDLFAAPKGVDDASLEIAQTEEGWILGS